MDKKSLNLGKINGKILLFGGVYSNLQSLKALQKIAKKNNILPENCICTGDIIGYCSQPEKTIQVFKNWGAKSIAGNVELQLSNDAENCGCDFSKGSKCDQLSNLWYPYAKSKLSENSLAYIKSLPEIIHFEVDSKKVTVLHGSYFNVSEFIFKSTPWEVKQKNFDITNAEIIIAGHSGLPFSEKKSKYHWVNPGVIGMPANDGNPKVWFAILNIKKSEIKIKHLNYNYNYQVASDLMLKNNLPKEYAKTLTNGLWDNMEILPEIEKQQKGFAIHF